MFTNNLQNGSELMLRMKTVIYIQVFCIFFNLKAGIYARDDDKKCESNIETRAVLLSCPEMDAECEDDPLSRATKGDEYRILSVRSDSKKTMEKIQREFPNRITHCKRKLIITMKLNNKGNINCDDGFIVIDHVYDPLTRGKARLLSPIVVKLRQEQMVHLYPIEFQKVVNSDPREQVFSKGNCPDYKGCSTNFDNPTCGITTYNGKLVPFSEGFCCPYDPYVNALREMSANLHENAFLYKDPGLFDHRKNRLTRNEKKTSMLINSVLTNVEADIQGLRNRNSFEEREEISDMKTEKLTKGLPNYLLEHDRQILCSAAALLQGMCNMNVRSREDEISESDAKTISNQEEKNYIFGEGNNDEINGNKGNGDKTNINNNSIKCRESKGKENKYNSEQGFPDGGKSTADKYDGGKMTVDKGDDIKFRNNKSTSDKDKNNADVDFSYNSSDYRLNIKKKENCRYNSKNVNSYGSRSSDSMLVNKAYQNKLKQNIFEPNRNIMNGIRGLVNVIDPSDGNQPEFAGDDISGKSIKPIETVPIEMESVNYLAAPRHRKKRLTRNREENGIPFQYLSNSRILQNSMIPAEFGDDETQPIEKCNRDAELCIEESSLNFSCIPQFFFAHDKKIVCVPSLCPECVTNSSTVTSSKPFESNETPAPCDYEEAYKNYATESADNSEDRHPLETKKSNKNKFSQLETSVGDKWKVNAGIENGNIFRLDMIKSNDRELDNNPEKIEEMKFEQKRIHPDYDGAKAKTNQFYFEKTKHFIPLDENYLLSKTKNLFENENRRSKIRQKNHFKQFAEQVKEEASDQRHEAIPGFSDREYSIREYKIEDLFRTGVEDRLHSRGDSRASEKGREMVEILVPNGKNHYRRYDLDLGSKNLKIFWNPESEREKSKSCTKNIDTSVETPYEMYVKNARRALGESEFSSGRRPPKPYSEGFNRNREINVNQMKRHENQRFFDTKFPSARKQQSLWNEAYHQQQRYPFSWNGINRMNFRYPFNLKMANSGKENIMSLSSHSYPHDFTENNEYMLSSQNAFFSDAKANRKKGSGNFKEHYREDVFRDSGISDTEGSLPRKFRLHFNGARNRERRRDYAEGNAFESNKKVAEPENFKFDDEYVSYGDILKGLEVKPEKHYYNFPPCDNAERSKNAKLNYPRKRRKVPLSFEPSTRFADPNLISVHSGEVQKLRNTRFVGNRVKRSIDKTSKSVRLSKWTHKTSEKPESHSSITPKTGESFTDPTKVEGSANFEDINDSFVKSVVRYIGQSGKSEKLKEESKIKKGKLEEERLMQSYRKWPNMCTASSPEENSNDSAEKRQKRGDQDYINNVESAPQSTTAQGTKIYRESSHCMEYSDLWYSVYKIKKPDLSHLVGIQLYDKQISLDGTSKWREITKGYMIRLGTFLPKAEDSIPTIAMTYTPTGPIKAKGNIDTENLRLLVPTHLANDKNSNLYPEFTGGPSEYLLVEKNEISETGRECNMIGSSFEAFARQPDRCSSPPGKCLKRSPTNLWREDLEAKIRGKRGKYFLENYGNVANTSIKSYSNLTGDFLAMDYYGEYTAVLEIEMRADGNAVVRKGENAQIPTVYINSLSPKKTVIILSVMNTGLTTGLFRPRLGDCPPKSDSSWCPLDGPLVQIPPQQRHDFKLELSNLFSRQIHCAVEIWNQENKKVAKRNIIIRKNDRCICAFFCKCICYDTAKDLSCMALSKREYNDAGYFDPIPRRKIPSRSVPSTEPFKTNLKIILLSMLIGLLLLGIIKAVLGLLWRRLGVCGIGVIVGPRTLSQYYERDISCFEVVYDECGFPVHPESSKTVQVVPRVVEAFLNVFFFYLYFLRIISLFLTSIPCFKLICSDCEACCKAEDNENQNVNHSNHTHELKNNHQSYNVTTFTSRNSKSDENTFYNPYKDYEDPLEEDDTEFVLEEIKRYKKKNSD